MAETDSPRSEDFRLDKQELASRLSIERWGEAKPLGEIAHADERFLDHDELASVLIFHSERLAKYGINFVPIGPSQRSMHS